MANLHDTLYVTSEGAYVSKNDESAVVKVDGAVRMQVPLHHLNSIVCFGWAGSPAQSTELEGGSLDGRAGRNGLGEHCSVLGMCSWFALSRMEDLAALADVTRIRPTAEQTHHRS